METQYTESQINDSRSTIEDILEVLPSVIELAIRQQMVNGYMTADVLASMLELGHELYGETKIWTSGISIIDTEADWRNKLVMIIKAAQRIDGIKKCYSYIPCNTAAAHQDLLQKVEDDAASLSIQTAMIEAVLSLLLQLEDMKQTQKMMVVDTDPARIENALKLETWGSSENLKILMIPSTDKNALKETTEAYQNVNPALHEMPLQTVSILTIATIMRMPK